MALSWEDVVNKQFQPTKFREGYDQGEVDDFLDEIVGELKRLQGLNEALTEENEALRAGGAVPAAATDAPEAAADAAVPVDVDAPAAAVDVAVVEPALADASAEAPGTDPASASAAGVLAMAQRVHDEHVAAGEQRRDELITEAEAEAQRLVAEAERTRTSTLEQLAEDKAGLEADVERLRDFETDYRGRLTAYIEGQLREIRSQERIEPAQPSA
ncbi:DivIVA domain-containing protein [Micrococcus endophyticus]|uniref:DivIVA domain-containing protein n=1 Tax=Micrococcus endophyticus TaxID=455343 RepID=UPI0034CF2F5D